MISDGLPTDRLWSVNTSHDRLFVGTASNSIFRTSLNTTSMAEFTRQPKYTAYPIPASSYAMVDGFTDVDTITAWSIHGVAVPLTGEPTPDGVRLDISGLAPGIWMVWGIASDGTVATTRLVVE